MSVIDEAKMLKEITEDRESPSHLAINNVSTALIEYEQALKEANRIIEAYSTEHTKYLAVDTWRGKYKHLLEDK